MTIPPRWKAFFLLFAWFGAGGPAGVFAGVVISEFMADNQTVLQDEDGDYSDWIELHNPGPGTVNLGGWYLTDNPAQLTRWALPSTNLAAGAYLVVFASEKDRTSPRLHANFKLSDSGEYLALVDASGTNVVSAYAPAYPEQYPDVSYGLQTQGTNPSLWGGRPGYLVRRTPGAANTCRPGPHPLYSDDTVLRADITISQSDWDSLMYDPWNETYRSITLRVRQGDLDVTVSNVGIRCRGNTSREKYPRSFNVALNAFVPGQKLFGRERLYWNSDVNDPTMARPKLINDLSSRVGLPTSYANHVALVVHGPYYHRGSPMSGGVFFDSVLNNTQPVDDVFVKERFGSSAGNLYKCNYRQWPASLEYRGPTGSSYIGDGTTYELKHDGGGDTSYNDLAEFIALINQTSDTDFPNAIMQAFDVDGFLQRIAIDVLCGNWDDYWANNNNYHLFKDPLTRRWIYLPYDFDNSLGIDWISYDWASRDIYGWGSGNGSGAPLMTRIMAVVEFRNRYTYYLKRMLDTVYTNTLLEPAVYQCRTNLIAALPIVAGSTSNMKFYDRQRYSGDWPSWTYRNFTSSYDRAQNVYNGNVPNTYAIGPFLRARYTNTVRQLNLQNIGPIISAFRLHPDLPRSDDDIAVSTRATDDVAVAAVELVYTFRDGPTNRLTLTNQAAGLYAAVLPAFQTNGILRYFLEARDNTGKSIYHPFGGAAYALSLGITNAANDLVITELNYNPYGLTAAELAAGVTDKENLEFLELHNAGAKALTLTGWRFTLGITFTFPACVLAPGEYAVICSSTNSFRARYPSAGIRVLGKYSGNLSNGGEALQLQNAVGQVVRQFTYGDSGDWPGRADGKGSSLEVLDPEGSYDDPFNWRSGSEYGGSPGAAGLGPDNRVVVNEVLTHTDPPLCDTIELFNTTESAVPVGGWYLTDNNSNYRKYRIPAGTVLSAGGYLVFNETNHFNASGGANTNDFALDGAHGDDIYLMEADAASNLLRFVDHPEFGATANGESLGRWPNGTGQLYPMVSRTFGAANSGPRVGPVLISEVMYHPPSGSNHLEFVELFNPTTQAVSLAHWQLDSGVAFAFPTDAVLAAGALLVVVPFDPASASNSALLAGFRATYGIGPQVALAGGYSGALDNGGDLVRLMRADDPPLGEPAYYPLLIEDLADYDDEAPWPAGADGGGSSLTRVAPAIWGASPGGWMAAAPSPGTHSSGGSNIVLSVQSEHGTPTPPAGQYVWPVGQDLTNSVGQYDIQGGVRYACAGWALAGNNPPSGTTNELTLTLTNHATLSWLWTTNYMLSVSAGPGGQVTTAGGWANPGAVVAVQAIPADGYRFAQWSGDTDAITMGSATSPTVAVTMLAPVTLVAGFTTSTSATYYVSPAGFNTPPYTNWVLAARDLQTAVDYAPAGATVLVAAATYALAAPVSVDKALTLRSADGPAVTILDGGGGTRCLMLTHPDAVVEGFAVRRADSGGSSGGGARLENGGLLVNCIVASNTTDKSGGGVALINGGAIRNCLVEHNTAGERGGGVYTYADGVQPAIHSSTLAGNSAGEGGGAYLFGDALLLNSIAWGNSAGSGSNVVIYGSGQDVRFSASGPALDGQGNIGQDPLFAAGGFRLQAASPCLDRGTNQAWMAGALELDTRPRVIHGRTDMGAYEALLDSWDSDTNGLPDWWEWRYGGVLTGMNPDADPDGDRVPNRLEYPAGTDPGNSQSFFGINPPTATGATGLFLIAWRSETGKFYRVECGTNLATGFDSVLGAHIPAGPPVNTCTDNIGAAVMRIYRVRLEP